MNLKGIAYEEIPIDLDAGEQHRPDFLARNPFGAVPALLDPEGQPLTQSLAILEYLEEIRPEPPLLPPDALGRARVRALACDVACDAHPLIVPRLKTYLMSHGFDAAEFRAWQGHWIVTGLKAIEAKLAASPKTGRFCHGDSVSIADICVSGLGIAAKLFRFDVPGIPVVERILEACWALDAFAKAHPLHQADAPPPS